MTRLFDDEQTTSLVRAMANPESNARKMAEQNQEIGVPSDITNDILNKYATYGANTGIGNLGGSRLVEAINDQYRKKVDEPLQQQEPPKAQAGMATSAAMPYDLSMLDLEQIKAAAKVSDEQTSIVEPPSAEVTSEPQLEAYNSPVTLPKENPAVSAPSLENVQVETKSEQLERYLKDNPMVAEALGDTGKVFGNILGKAAVGQDDTKSVASARAPVFQASQIARTPIGMNEGGAPTAETTGDTVNPGLMAILKTLGSILGQQFISDDDTKRLVAAVAPKKHPLSQVEQDQIGMSAGGKPPEGSVLGRKLFLEGGEVDGPGGPKEDLVPIWASDKEYVMSHKAVKRMGNGDFDKGIAALDKINFGK